VAALSRGTIDGASVTLAGLLRPLEAGADVRVVAGLHAGCLRVSAPEAATLGGFGDLRGASVGVDRIHGPSMDLLWALVRRQGLDPATDLSWRVVSEADVAREFEAKTIACVAASDPLAFRLLAGKIVAPYVDTSDGGFTCGTGIGKGHHCFLALGGRFVGKRPTLAAAITRAYLGAAAAIARGAGPAALAAFRERSVDGDLYEAIAMLSSYDWSATTDLVREEIELTARDFRRAGLLSHDTDVEQLADRAYADVLHDAA
jgi:NitT/TauT family transport system substrate-binding protein